MKSIRVLLADDHKLVRAGIRSLLERVPELEVVAEASDGKEALQLVEKHQPQVVLMDLSMPELNGLEATRHLTKAFPNVQVIILSIYSDEEHVYQSLRAGAAGYLMKGAATDELELAIRSVARGETYLSPPVSKPVIMEYIRRTNIGLNPREGLSPRQTQILKLIAEGETTKQVALHLAISVKTVETHRSALMKRIGVRDVAGLVRYAVKVGLVDLQL
ncbi:MAG TPA: response regulator transcription factor [Pyrinomonadaceae bacterium]|nr:response regulator transcription factor [Pyrinomonadaceae bacterium]